MAPILAVARLTIQESIRKKAFLVMALFCVLLLSSSAFFPELDPRGRVRLLVSWSLRSTTLFGFLLVVFVSSLSLPQDIEERKVYMLITKPLSRPGLFLGKFLGFAGLVAMFLVGMGAIGVGFARFVAKVSGREADEVFVVREQSESRSVEVLGLVGEKEVRLSDFSNEEPARVWAEGPQTDFVAWQFRGINFTPDPPGCVDRLVRVSIEVHARRRPGATEKSEKVRVTAYTRLSNPLNLLGGFQWHEASDGGKIELEIPKSRFLPDDGDLRVAILQPVDGPLVLGASPLDASAFLVNRFPGRRSPTVDEVEYHWDPFSSVVGAGYTQNQSLPLVEALHNAKLQKDALTLHASPPLVARWTFQDLDPGAFDDEAAVQIRLPIKGPAFTEQSEMKAGYLVATLRYPDGGADVREKLRVPTNKLVTVPLTRDRLRAGQPLLVDFERGEADTNFSIVPEGVTLRGARGGFEACYFRVLLLVYLELILLLSVILFCSTWLSGPVSLTVGIAVFLFGVALESVHESFFQIDSIIRTTEVLEATARDEEAKEAIEGGIPLWSMKASRFLLRNVVMRVFPELSRFEGTQPLLSGVMLPGRRIASAAAYVAISALAWCLLGMLVLRFRQFR